MEYTEIPKDKETTGELPRWVKILFRFYAIFFLAYLSIIGILLSYSMYSKGKELLRTLEPNLGIFTISAFSAALAILILHILYGVGIYKFKRWTLPLIITFSLSTVLIGFLRLLDFDFTGLVDLIGFSLVTTFTISVVYAATKYWTRFPGSARRLRIQIPLLLTYLPFILFGTLSQIFTDDAHIHDSDLLLQPVEILPQADNAYYFLPDIARLPEEQRKTYEAALGYVSNTNGADTSSQEALDLITQTRNITDTVLQASSKKGYQCPSSVNTYSLDVELCSLNEIRNLATLTAFRADVEAATGSVDQAVVTATAVIQLGALVANTNQPVLIEHLLGIAIMNIGFDSLEQTLNRTATSSDKTIRLAIAKLEQSKIDAGTFADSLRREYMSLKDASAPFEAYSSYFYHHNKTTNQRAVVLRKSVSIASQSCDVDTTQEQQEVDQLVDEILSSARTWPVISPNVIGKVFNSTVVASPHSAHQKGCEVNWRNEHIQALLKSSITREAELENAYH